MTIDEDLRIPENLREGKESVRITSPDQYLSEDTSESTRVAKQGKIAGPRIVDYFVNV